MNRIFLFLIDLYRKGISPFRPSSCRFVPSCSAYAREAISEYGAVRGSFLTLARLFRCQPFCSGGYDPVPREERITGLHEGEKSMMEPRSSH